MKEEQLQDALAEPNPDEAAARISQGAGGPRRKKFHVLPAAGQMAGSSHGTTGGMITIDGTLRKVVPKQHGRWGGGACTHPALLQEIRQTDRLGECLADGCFLLWLCRVVGGPGWPLSLCPVRSAVRTGGC